jgi:quercetin dioxygenase-like cupin family protein
MHITSAAGATPITTGRFTGSVELVMLAAGHSDDTPDTALGHFHGGAVTYWHQHPGGQMLFVISGTARIGTNDGEVALPAGTLVVSEPLERHWHGANSDADCAMLTLTWGTTLWEEQPPL